MINEANILKRINNLDYTRTGDTVFVKLHDVYEIIFDEMNKASETSRTISSNDLRWNTTPIPVTCQAPDVNINDYVKSISQT